jgi:hypothetical protein
MVIKEQRSWPGRTAWLIRSELLGRTELRRGEMAEIARSLDCSRERVRQIAARAGIRVNAGRPKLVACSDCGRQIAAANKSGLCAACRHQRTLVTLTCIVCGKDFQRRRKDYNDFIRRVTVGERQGPRCSKACGYSGSSRFCSWCGAEVARRPPSTRGYHAFCGAGRRCDLEAMKLVQPVHWPKLGSHLLPMRDHVAQIAELLGPKNLTGASRRARYGLTDAPPVAV